MRILCEACSPEAAAVPSPFIAIRCASSEERPVVQSWWTIALPLILRAAFRYPPQLFAHGSPLNRNNSAKQETQIPVTAWISLQKIRLPWRKRGDEEVPPSPLVVRGHQR